MAKQYFASDYAYGLNAAVAPMYVNPTGTTATGVGTLSFQSGTLFLADGRKVTPFATTAPVLVGTGAVAETITPSAVSNNGSNIQSSFAGTFTYIHGVGTTVASGTAGLQEAINDCVTNGGGVVYVTAQWTALGGTSAMLAAATGGTTVAIADFRSGTAAFWTFNGTTFQLAGVNAAPVILYPASGAISVASQTAILTKAGVDAMTLAAPTTAQNGMVIVVTSTTANAHTVTATGLFQAGTAAVNVATLGAFAGSGFTVMANAGKWVVISNNTTVFS